MTRRRATKKAIRERMARTGEPYSVAARALAADQPDKPTETGLVGVFGPRFGSQYREAMCRSTGVVLVVGHRQDRVEDSLVASVNDAVAAWRAAPKEWELKACALGSFSGLDPEVVQVVARPDQPLSFSEALRIFLRSDPDIILAGPMLDGRDARLAVEVAQTGHLMFSSMAGTGAAQGLLALRDRFALPAWVLAEAVSMVVAQRLVRTLCPRCRVTVIADQPALDGLGMSQRKGVLYDAEGCRACGGTGFAGAKLVHEILEVTPAVSEWLEAARHADPPPMSALRAAVLRMEASGKTSVGEARRVLALPSG